PSGASTARTRRGAPSAPASPSRRCGSPCGPSPRARCRRPCRGAASSSSWCPLVFLGWDGVAAEADQELPGEVAIGPFALPRGGEPPDLDLLEPRRLREAPELVRLEAEPYVRLLLAQELIVVRLVVEHAHRAAALAPAGRPR